ncbi:MAG TPA: hypothetical protein PLW65_26085 [Pseudomonadota bacterium]|nr:hypothetical protein [Pseudomonadota bacterium]
MSSPRKKIPTDAASSSSSAAAGCPTKGPSDCHFSPSQAAAGATPGLHPAQQDRTPDAAAGVLGHWAQDGAHAAAPPRRLSPREQFDSAYEDLRNRQLNEAEQSAARWRELSATELAAATPQDPLTAPKAGELGYTTSVGGHTYKYDRVAEDPNRPTQARDLLGPEASQFHSRALVTDRPKQDPTNARERAYQDVTVLNSNGTTSTLSQNDSGVVELPTQGFGFSTYNRNDVDLPGDRRHPQKQKDQWGTPDAVARIINIANDYGTLHAGENDAAGTLQPGRTIQYGDLATDDNQSPLLESGRSRRHASHGTADQVDIRYPSTTFDTNTFIRTAEGWGANNFYYSPSLEGQAYFGSGTHNATNAEHRNHLHMGFGLGGR